MRETVHCIAHSAASQEDIWAVVADFNVDWHPMVAWSKIEPSTKAQIIRRFSTGDEDDIMRERLTYFSASDHTIAYDMVEGIEGASSYNARLKIFPSEGGSTITWNAEITANSALAPAIADGTRGIFEAGLEVLASPLKPTPVTPEPLGKSALAQLTMENTPRLGLTVAPEGLDTAGTICLFLHGIGGNRGNWDDQVAALAHIMPTVALDLRGYGDSTLGFSPSQLDDYFGDIKCVMTKFGARKVVLCGLSYGSWIATSFALSHPDVIAGLILCGGCTGMSEADPDERESFRVSREVPLDAGQTPADFAAGVVDVIAGPTASEDVRAKLHASMAKISAATYRDALSCFCNPLEKLDFQKADFPVLLMTGEHDKLAPPSEIRAVSYRFADAKAPYVSFEVIPDAGHVCNLEQPEAVNAHLAQFLRIISPPAAGSPKVAKKSAKHARILDAALREFSMNGYSGASMQSIARRAEVSKPTLYQYIGSKEDIFRAVLDQGRSTIVAPLKNPSEMEMTAVLWDFAWGYARYVLHPDNLSIARLVIGEAERTPDIARQFHEAGPARALKGIAEYLEERRTDGMLSFECPTVTAEHLWSLILSGPRNHAFYFPQDLPDEATLANTIYYGLQVFLRAYSTTPDTDLASLADKSRKSPTRRTT